MSEKLSEFSETSDCTKAAALIREVAPSGTTTDRIGIAARALGWAWNRTKAVWYEEARRIDAHEMDALRAAIRKREEEEASREFRELDARLRRIEAAIAVAHPTLDRDTLDERQQEILGPRPVDRTGAGRSDGGRGE